MSPDRVVVGVESERAKELMTRLYRPFLLNNFRVIFMDVPSAEMTKYAANAMLATRISFMNDVANLCEIVGADVNMVRKGSARMPVSATVSCMPVRLWRFLFPKRYKSVDQNGQVERLPDAYPRSGRGGQRRAEIHLVPQVGRLFQG